jgi:hypothetical protein
MMQRPDIAPAPEVPKSGHRRTLMWVTQDGEQIRITADGVARIPTDIDALDLEPGGSLIVTEDDRRLEVRPSADGGLTYRYTVDGVEQPFDDQARIWVNDVLARSGVEVGDQLTDYRWTLTVDGADRVLRIYPSGRELSTLESLEPPAIELPALELHQALEQLEVALEPLELSLTLAMPQQDLEVALEGLEVELEPLEVTLAKLGTTLELQPAELSLSQLGTELESLELTLDGLRDLDIPDLRLPAVEFADLGMGRFDSVRIWRDGESRVAVMSLGEVQIGATADDITVGEDGNVVIDERGPDGRRRLQVYADADGNPVFEWYVDGKEAPFDDAARAWLQPILERLR